MKILEYNIFSLFGKNYYLSYLNIENIYYLSSKTFKEKKFLVRVKHQK